MTATIDAVYKPRQEAFKPLRHPVEMRVISRTMAKIMIDRIENRLKELNLSPRAASLRVSTNADLVRGVLRSGDDANPTQDTIAKIAEALEVDVPYLLGEADAKPPGSPRASEVRRAAVTIPAGQSMQKNLPVWGTAAGSIIDENFEGLEIFSATAVDYVRRPPSLLDVLDAYAIYVTGDSMDPLHPDGALRIVHPHRPPLIGDSVIVMTKHWETDPGQAYIKILERRTAEWIVLHQLHPDATIRIPRKYVQSIHKVLDMNDLFGV